LASPPRSKTHEMWWNLSFKTEETKSVKFLIYRKFHLGQFTAFWKNIWTSVRLQPNKCPTSTWRSVNFWLNQNDCHYTSSLLTSFSAIWLPSFLKTHDGIKRKVI
jgi:hypothetical protein